MMQSIYRSLQEIFYRLDRLEKENQMLKTRLAELKPIVIENINYRIQDLNVDELKGTLHIGITGEAKVDEVGLPQFFDEEDGNIIKDESS